MGVINIEEIEISPLFYMVIYFYDSSIFTILITRILTTNFYIIHILI